jgi:hypothetical protein
MKTMTGAKIGRPKGAKNKKTILREEAAAAAAANMSPAEFLISIMRSPQVDTKTRITAAGIAARYTHPLPGKAAGQEPPVTIESRPIDSRAWTPADRRRMRELEAERTALRTGFLYRDPRADELAELVERDPHRPLLKETLERFVFGPDMDMRAYDELEAKLDKEEAERWAKAAQKLARLGVKEPDLETIARIAPACSGTPEES